MFLPTVLWRRRVAVFFAADPGIVCVLVIFFFCFLLLFWQEHPVFRRKGADLVIEKNLTLVESLCGFDFSITHMDKRSLRVKSNPGQVRYSYTWYIHVICQGR